MTPAPTGPALPRPVVFCALLALAGHTALLALSPAANGAHHRAEVQPAARPLLVNLVAPRPAELPRDPEVIAPLPAPAPQDDATPPEALPAQAAEPTPPVEADSTRPSFEEPPPLLNFPDAALPEGGVQVRVHVRVDGDGSVQQTATALWPADAPAAFAKLGGRAVADTRFTPGEADRSHCLQLDFKPDERRPIWSWRTDGATRCLTNPADSAQALPAR